MNRLISLAGTRIAHYELVSVLGSGGMGVVYLARDTRLHRKAAVKLLRNASEGAAAERFMREARAVASLDHPNICTLFEVGVDQGHEFLAMQYVEGCTLAARLKEGPLPFDEALRIGIELTSALAYAHSKQILHRDLKPQNVMLQPDGRVTLLDFGLAKLTPTGAEISIAETNAPLTQEGVVVGTLEYMSPEQMSARTLDARSDIFSLGLILYELIDGRHPYREHTAALTMSGILTKPYPPLTGTHVPQAPMLNPVLRKALALEPGDRYATAADLLVDLRRLDRGLDRPALDVAARGSRTWRLAGAVLLAIAVLAILSVPLLRRRMAPVAVSSPPAQLDRTLSYWLDVRPPGRDDPAGVTRVVGDDSLAGGAKVRVNVVSATPGFLYMLDQEGDDAAALALVYPVATDSVNASTRSTTGWYGFSTGAAVDHLWLVWSADVVPELEALRPLVNERDLGRIGDAARARGLRAWLDQTGARTVRATEERSPRQVTIAFSGPIAIRHILLHHTGGSSS